MDRKTFDELDKLEQIEYINKALAEGGSITNIVKSIGIGRTTIRDRFDKLNYVFDKKLNKYVENNNSTTDVIKPVSPSLKLKDITIKEEIEEPQVANNNCVTDVINIDNVKLQQNLLSIANEYDTLIQMIESFKQNSSILEKQIVIDLPSKETTLSTVRINSKALEQFNKFVEDNNQYKKVDLLSMALLEYVKNHS